MPWKMIYEEAPKDESLRVWQTDELPLGTHIHGESLLRSFREAEVIIAPDTYRHWYECRHCGGWIEGTTNAYRVNTLDSWSLSGRSGTEYHCIRCGQQIAFMGMMS